MNRTTDLCLTALAPIIWGSSYIVTTEMLPDGYPLTVALLRALPAGLILLLVVRRLPPAGWRGRVFILGALNFAVFWSMLFVAAYRLPGGVAATLGAIQPLLVLFLARFALGSGITMLGIIAAISGLIGVAMLVLGPTSSLDPIGIAAALFGAASMAAGTVMTRKWQPPVSPLTFTAWQLTAGGILMIPVALILEPGFPVPTVTNLAGLVWLGLIGAALTYYLWFRGIARLGPTTVTSFGFLSPTSAVLLGWIILGEALSPLQMIGVIVVLASIWLGQRAACPAPAPVAEPAPAAINDPAPRTT
ncbi:MAG: EamA family transporter [Thalassospira sp.]|uniref:EamA family transporter n=1 Tax=unclassified Thalassospira TaxID=2648997 RepID=UPI0007A60F69|nr:MULTISPECIES: EamA family transporter [unclassified Thalassospira]KZD02447.1 ABC transporter permease [Thalassospira sp. MCCC 1A02898]MBE71202.1 EamA family transporter [Thalassospira sp.]ONH88989.1 ABC transporter permease [Thalassospira sp. MCCC 1A02803]